jgi:hypothetical protein
MEQMTPHRHSPGQAYRPRLYGDTEERNPVDKYDPANSGELVYKDFIIRREPEYGLWQITNYDGKQITGMQGMYTSAFIAQAKIDEYLKKQEDEKKSENRQTSN